jgi:hypothetical protein
MNPLWFLVEILLFLLIRQVLVDQIVAMQCPLGTPTILKILCESVERIGRSGIGFGGVDPRVVVHSKSPVMTATRAFRPCRAQDP